MNEANEMDAATQKLEERLKRRKEALSHGKERPQQQHEDTLDHKVKVQDTTEQKDQD